VIFIVMEEQLRNTIKHQIRVEMESYLKENGINYSKKLLQEKTQGEIDAEKEEFKGRIATKQEQIKALNDQIKQLQTIAAKLNSEKPDEV
jgi:regulatory protein YycI of two-component signal transduction system YycFG